MFGRIEVGKLKYWGGGELSSESNWGVKEEWEEEEEEEEEDESIEGKNLSSNELFEFGKNLAKIQPPELSDEGKQAEQIEAWLEDNLEWSSTTEGKIASEVES